MGQIVDLENVRCRNEWWWGAEQNWRKEWWKRWPARRRETWYYFV